MKLRVLRCSHINRLVSQCWCESDTRVGGCLELNIKCSLTRAPVPAPWGGARLGKAGFCACASRVQAVTRSLGETWGKLFLPNVTANVHS